MRGLLYLPDAKRPSLSMDEMLGRTDSCGVAQDGFLGTLENELNNILQLVGKPTSND